MQHLGLQTIDGGVSDTGQSRLHSDALLISESRKRSLQLGLDPMRQFNCAVLSLQDFYEAQQSVQWPLMFARPEMELLSQQVAGSENLTAFADPDGNVIEVIASEGSQDSQLAQVVCPGSMWKEEHRGTNALGLAAKHKMLACVNGPEHFHVANSSISCAAAPIFDSSGSVLGLLDVTSGTTTRQHHLGSLVNLAAVNISNRLFIEEHRNDLILLLHPRREFLDTQSAGMLAFDAEGQLTGRNMTARKLITELAEHRSHQFNDLFQQDFGQALTGISRGETVSLRDGQNAAFFAKLRLTRGKYLHLAPRTKSTVVQVEAVRIPKPTTRLQDLNRQNGDELLQHRVKMASEALRLGLPVRISGTSGNGLSQIATDIHNKAGISQRRVVVECDAIVSTRLSSRLNGEIFDTGDQTSDKVLDAENPATVVLDGIDKLGTQALSLIRSLAEQVQNLNETRDPESPMWALLAIENRQTDSSAHISDIWGFTCDVIPLSERTDLFQVATNILEELAPGYKMSKSATSQIGRLGPELTFYSLRRLLFQLSRKPDGTVIREEDVTRLLPWLSSECLPCESCAGHPVKEIKCIGIQQAVASCGGNVSMAARRIKLSRTTIYKHIGLGP